MGIPHHRDPRVLGVFGTGPLPDSIEDTPFVPTHLLRVTGETYWEAVRLVEEPGETKGQAYTDHDWTHDGIASFTVDDDRWFFHGEPYVSEVRVVPGAGPALDN